MASAISFVIRGRGDWQGFGSASHVGSLNRGDEVKLHGFGSFRLHQKEARTRSNPKTGARVDLPAKKVLRFKPGKELLQIINRKAAR